MARRIERHHAAAEALIASLDAMDGDPDLEPSLGAPESTPQTHWADGSGALDEENAEAEDAGGGDVLDEAHDADTDLEPSLGAPEIGPTAVTYQSSFGYFRQHGTQEFWAKGKGDMEEESSEDAEPDSDEGPSWSESVDQTLIGKAVTL